MILSPSEKMTKARVGLVFTSPFYASIALRLKSEEDPGIPTMCTNGVWIKYNPDFVDSLTELELKTVLCHEVLHVTMLHMFRRESRDPWRWNVACDYAINYILAKSKEYRLPDGALFNRDYDNMTAEAIYDKLPNKIQSGYLAIGDVADHPSLGDNDKQDGGGQGGTEEDGGFGIGISGDAIQAEQDWKQVIAAAANSARMAGNLPAGLERLIDKLLNPKLPWQEILQRFVSDNTRNDYIFKYPNKRYIYAGLYLPTLQTPTLGTVGVLVDTSGSINDEQLTEFASELRSALSIYPGSDAEVVYVDATVAGHERLTAEDLKIDKMNAKGGGGTDFCPGFEYLEKESIDPICIIYFTDGYCNSFPCQAPDCPVLWIINSGLEEFNPPFGEVINM